MFTHFYFGIIISYIFGSTKLDEVKNIYYYSAVTNLGRQNKRSINEKMSSSLDYYF